MRSTTTASMPRTESRPVEVIVFVSCLALSIFALQFTHERMPDFIMPQRWFVHGTLGQYRGPRLWARECRWLAGPQLSLRLFSGLEICHDRRRSATCDFGVECDICGYGPLYDWGQVLRAVHDSTYPSKLAGLGLRCVGHPALEPLDLSVVIRFVLAHVEPLAIIVRRSPRPVVV